MERLEQAIYHDVEMYEGYAKPDGKLHPKELRNIIEKEIQNPELKAKLGAVDFDKAMKRMDKNSDGDIDFNEFLKCISISSMAKSHYDQKTSKGKEECRD